jgi:signal transduction histidine kinase
MANGRPAWPIRLWLGTFGAAVALPFVVLLVLMFASQIRSERLAARDAALRIARAAAGRIVALRADSASLLEHMANRSAIEHFDSEPCDSLFAVVDFFPQYMDLFLFDSKGHMLCSANPQSARDRMVSMSTRGWLEEDIARGRLEPGSMSIRQVGERWATTLTRPIRSAGTGATATLALVALPDIIATEALPEDTVVTIMDANGTVLARSKNSLRWTGTNSRMAGVTRIVLEKKEGTAEATGIDGVQRQYGFTFIRELGWYIYVGVPTAVLLEPVRRLYVRGVSAGLLVVLIAVIVATILSGAVERPMNELAAVASSMARGAYQKVNATRRSPREVSTLASAFNEMVDSRSLAEQKLEEGEQRLKALSERLLVIQEEERARIARAIHDDLGQSLTALKMDILGLMERSGMPASSTTERVRRTLDSTVTAVQRIATELRPSVLDDLGLVAALESEVRLFEERTGIECELSLPRHPPLVLDATASTVLYRIFQEALTNVLRHSNASRVEIRMRERGEDVVLEVRDNGRGITAEEVSSPTSIGLIGIRERAAMIDGSADFEGIVNRGTIVSVRIPRHASEVPS